MLWLVYFLFDFWRGLPVVRDKTQKAESMEMTARDDAGNRTNTKQIWKMQGHILNSGVKGSESWFRSPGYTENTGQGTEGPPGPAAPLPWPWGWAWLQCGLSSGMGLPERPSGDELWKNSWSFAPRSDTVVSARPLLPVSWGQAVARGWGAQPSCPSGFSLAREVRRPIGVKKPLGWVRSEKQLKMFPFSSLYGGYFDFFFLKCVFYR